MGWSIWSCLLTIFEMTVLFLGVEFEEFFIDPGYQPFVCTVICEYLLPFRGLPLCFVDCFLCHAEAFDLDQVPKVHFCFCFLYLWRRVLKEIAVADIEEVTVYVLLQGFDGFLSHVEVFHPFSVYLCVWCTKMAQFHSSPHGHSIFPAPFIEETVFYHWIFFPLHCWRLSDHRVEGNL